jgi:KAP family P-loop domain
MVRNKLNRELVSWNAILKDVNANKELREYIKQAFEQNWIDSQLFQKIDDRSIGLYDERLSKSITLIRNEEKTKATLRIDEKPVYDFSLDTTGEDDNLKLRENNILTIWFNAWRYESEQDLALIPLMKMIAYAMGEHPIYKHIRPIILKALFIIGKDVLRHYATQYIMTEEGIDEFEKNIENKLDRSAEFEKDVLYFDGMKKIQEEMEYIHRTYKDTRIVIFIDDLDRCDPQKALQVFESTKVFLDMKGFIFVLGLSKSTLIQLIQIKLRQMGLDETKAEEYLHKIIQVDIQIKKWTSGAINEIINNLLNKIEGGIRDKIKGDENGDNISLIEDSVELNPRQAKRLTNSLVISIAANPSLNVISYLLVESVSKKWTVFYENISDVEFLKFCKSGLEMSQEQRHEYIDKLKKDLEEKAKSNVKPNELERKILVFEKEFLDPNLWSFLEKHKNINKYIFSNISSDQSRHTEEELRVAKEFKVAKSARESVQEVKPTQETKQYTEEPRGAAVRYYTRMIGEAKNVRDFITLLMRTNRRKFESRESAYTAIMEEMSVQGNKIEDWLLYFKQDSHLQDIYRSHEPEIKRRLDYIERALREVDDILRSADTYDAQRLNDQLRTLDIIFKEILAIAQDELEKLGIRLSQI